MPSISTNVFSPSSKALGQVRESQAQEPEVNVPAQAVSASSADTVAFTPASLARQGEAPASAVSGQEAQGLLSSLRQAASAGVDLFSAHYAPDPGRVAMLLAGAD